MAYFAELDPSNTVLRVLSVSNQDCPDPAPANEQQGIDFLAGLGLGSNWKQTLLHESIHACLYFSGAGEGLTMSKEESIVLALEHGLWPLLFG